jgi:hypothetical protein
VWLHWYAQIFCGFVPVLEFMYRQDKYCSLFNAGSLFLCWYFTIIYKLLSQETRPFMDDSSIYIGGCDCTYGMPSMNTVRITYSSMIVLVGANLRYKSEKLSDSESRNHRLKWYVLWMTLVEVSSMVLIIAIGIADIYLAYSTIAQIVIGYLFASVVLSTLMVIRRYSTFVVKKEFWTARNDIRVRRKLISMAAVYLITFLSCNWMWIGYILTRQNYLDKKYNGPWLDHCPSCVWDGDNDLDLQECGYLNYAMYPITIAICMGILACYDSKRLYKEVGCIGRSVRLFVKSLSFVIFTVSYLVVFFKDYRKFWHEYTMYQIGIKAPIVILSSLVYFALPSLFFRCSGIDVKGDFLFDYVDEETRRAYLKYNRSLWGTKLRSEMKSNMLGASYGLGGIHSQMNIRIKRQE